MTSFAAKKARWIERVARDRDLTHLAFRVAYLLSTHLNKVSGDAWPSQPTLAGELGVTVRAVQLSLDALVSRGHLLIEVAKGRNNTNRYRPVLEVKKANPRSPIVDGKDEPEFVIDPPKTRTAEKENTNACSKKHEPPFVQTFSKGTFSKENLGREMRARSDDGGKTTLPPDLKLTTPMIAYAQAQGFDQIRANAMFIAFQNHHRAKGTQYADWTAGWNVWVDKEHKFKSGDFNPSGSFL